MKKQLDAYEQSPDKTEPPVVTKEERESFAALIEQINQVTEMASEPALAADGRRKSASINPELTALSDDIDTAGLAVASEKDDLRAELAERLGKLFPQPDGLDFLASHLTPRAASTASSITTGASTPATTSSRRSWPRAADAGTRGSCSAAAARARPVPAPNGSARRWPANRRSPTAARTASPSSATPSPRCAAS